MRGTFVASNQTAGMFASGVPGTRNVGTLGIMCEPLEQVEAQVAALGAARADVAAPSSTALVLAGPIPPTDPILIAQKVSIDFCASFSQILRTD